MTAVAMIVLAAVSCGIWFLVGRNVGRKQGVAASIGIVAHALATAPQAQEQHHRDLHDEIDMLRMALAEANRRLADTGVTITVEEVAAFYDIAENEGGEQP